MTQLILGHGTTSLHMVVLGLYTPNSQDSNFRKIIFSGNFYFFPGKLQSKAKVQI
jgi:hypothetical protein